ncbi:right-handed parallel beta-helix repeat-containing protein (plasmid) [Roseobacteraceae bacterium NS-SX3]
MATTISVSSAAELDQALASATGGETILLAAGNYGGLTLRKQFSSEVTIKAADPAAMATLSSLNLNGASNVTFDGIKFDYVYQNGDYHHTRPFQVLNSSDIAIKNALFDGDLDPNGVGFGLGLNVNGSQNVTIADTEFTKWWKGAFLMNSDGVALTGNEVHTIRADGLVFDNTDNVLVEGNYMHDFGALAGANDHRDMIQFQRATGSGSSNIVVRDNVFDMGAGDYTQTIFMGTSGKNASDPNVRNYNVTIENNLIYNGHYHGITLNGLDGVTIRNNSVLHVDDKNLTGGVEVPHINIDGSAKNVTIEQNVVAGINGYSGQSDWSVQDNAIVQATKPGAANHYDNVFTYHATAAADGYNQFGVKTGSIVDTLNAGSSLTANYPAPYSDWVGTGGGTVPTPLPGGGTGGNGGSDTGNTGGSDTGGSDTGNTGGSDTGGTQPAPQPNPQPGSGTAGDDVLSLSSAGTLSGLAGDDQLTGSAGGDTLEGNGGSDDLLGLAGDDTLKGGGGHDVLEAGNGKDKLRGGAGRDTLDGGEGNDKLFGGKGGDVFIFDQGNDRVKDFGRGADVIEMDVATGIHGFSDLMANHATETKAGVLIQDDDGDSLLLLNVQLTDLSDSDFLF